MNRHILEDKWGVTPEELIDGWRGEIITLKQLFDVVLMAKKETISEYRESEEIMQRIRKCIDDLQVLQVLIQES